jgi:SAM-dependent methyltransferase
MPSIEQNLALWNQSYDWRSAGDEWSTAWGGTDQMWQRTVYPRIKKFLPAGTITILEIAPGFGRCTHYLKSHCKELIVVDLSPRCIEACKRRFATESHITYHVNDGKSLSFVPDCSVDFVFSFDSLVHVQAEVMESYVRELAAKLKPGGNGFIHHSNLGNYRTRRIMSRFARKLGSVGTFLERKGLLIDPVWRGDDMSAALFVEFCRRYGLHCETQELINWANRGYLIDCISTFDADSNRKNDPAVIRNPGFMKEVQAVRPVARAATA